MTTATAQDRLRQIAILVSSVDATAARQILLHLPTDKARQVRALAQQLGAVAPEEKRKILAEFQRSAASAASSSPVSHLGGAPSVAAPQPHNSHSIRPQVGSAHAASQRASGASLGHAADAFFSDRPNATANSAGEASLSSTNQDTVAPAWTRLNTAALVRFVRGERSAVTAVVISQLSPSVAVEVLQHLPSEISREVLLRLSRLQEIDPEAMTAIDEHLSQRLQEYQHHIQSELENSRRIESLLAAAPTGIRQQWAQVLAETPATANDAAGSFAVGGNSQSPEKQTSSQQDGHLVGPAVSAAAMTPDLLDIGGSVFTTVDHPSQPTAARGGPATQLPSAAGSAAAGTANILPFPRAPSESGSDVVDRSLIQIEFEQILQLPPPTLAHLLSNTDSQTVLLALAGATPEFMQRFYHMLDRGDARALQNRLQRIGAIQLRDVDEAQRRIIENAAQLAGGRGRQVTAGQSRKAA